MGSQDAYVVFHVYPARQIIQVYPLTAVARPADSGVDDHRIRGVVDEIVQDVVSKPGSVGPTGMVLIRS